MPPNDNILEEQLSKQKAAIERVLRNGDDVTLKQVAWLLYALQESQFKIVDSQQRYRDECPAYVFWARSSWWRSPLRSAAGTLVAWLLLGAALLFIGAILSGGITLPTIP